MRNAGSPNQARRLQAIDAYLAHSPLRLGRTAKGTVAAWFLGPKGENQKLLSDLLIEAIRQHCESRRDFHPEDPIYITRDIKKKKSYQKAVQNLHERARELYRELRLSAPISSMRHQGHMLWDQVLPGMVGYFAAMLYNQNNVAAEASPVTTGLEIEVGNDLCRMLGFDVPASSKKSGARGIVPWGHITCDGSVANIEGLWAARNAKFLAIALQAALREVPVLAPARSLKVKLLDGSSAPLLDLDPWVLLNLKIDDVVGLPYQIESRYGIKTEITAQVLSSYSVQSIGMFEFYRRFLPGFPAPVAIVPSTRHYSWPKAGALLGIGQNNILKVYVDLRARVDIGNLADVLRGCLEKHVPVIAVVAVIGSTEESAVDPLVDILALRERFRKQGMEFAVHCDAAWGGYFNTMLRGGRRRKRSAIDVPAMSMSRYVVKQYRALRHADSITVDPHKAGYVPYPAGGLCYRNSAMRDLISLRAPVVFHSQTEPTVGVYGVEGSKPGAAAAGVYLAHRVIPLDKNGYGDILGKCMWTSTRLYCRLVTLADRDDREPSRLKIVVFQMLPAERRNEGEAAVENQRNYIRDNFVHRSNEDLRKLLKDDEKARELFMELGSDQVILAYSFNFFDKSGKRVNTDAEKLKKLNDEVFNLCSIMDPRDNLNKKELIVTSSAFDVENYGNYFVDHYCTRLGIRNPNNLPVPFLISTTMDPWTTDTTKGDFLEKVEDGLRNAFYRALNDLESRRWSPRR